jgi:chromosome segregation ATPase
MTEPPDLDHRVTRLEQEMILLRHDTSVATALARDAGLDESAVHDELSAHTRTLDAMRTTQAGHSQWLRAHTASLNALRETQAEQSQTLRAHTRSLSALRETQAEHSQILRGHTQTLKEHGQILREHTHRFDRLEQKVDHGFSAIGAGMDNITALLTNKIKEGECQE